MKKIAAIAAAASLVGGCASITDGTEQTIVIGVTPRTATCIASRNGTELSSFTGQNPTLTVSKGARDITIECKAPGYDTKVGRLVSSTTGAGMTSVLLIDFGITDMITGAMWKYPSNSSIVLERSAGAFPTDASTVVTAPVTAAAVVQRATGKDLFYVTKLAVGAGCSADPRAALTGQGPGYEAYSVPCTDGETMMVRCEYGNCRVLK